MNNEQLAVFAREAALSYKNRGHETRTGGSTANDLFLMMMGYENGYIESYQEHAAILEAENKLLVEENSRLINEIKQLEFEAWKRS